MSDYLVRLYNLSDDEFSIKGMMSEGIVIKRALAPDKSKIVQWVKEVFGEGWASECDVAFSNQPVTCFIALEGKKIVGFACYEATYKDYFGPTGVDEKYRGKGIGKALFLKCLHSMKELGYAYAIIGSAAETAVEFYKKAAGATEIEGSSPGIYINMIR